MSNGTSRRILASAQAFIATGGYHGFSFADIASVVGLGKVSIHHHFPTNADLVQVLVASYREEAETGMARNPRSCFRRMLDTGQNALETARSPSASVRFLAGEAPTLPAEVAAEVRAYFQSFASWFADALERGVGRGVFALRSSAREEAEALMATFQGAMLLARAYGDPKIFGIILASSLRRLTV